MKPVKIQGAILAHTNEDAKNGRRGQITVTFGLPEETDTMWLTPLTFECGQGDWIVSLEGSFLNTLRTLARQHLMETFGKVSPNATVVLFINEPEIFPQDTAAVFKPKI